ncbi:MAG: DNA primase noncatalytic subunit PriX [Candidatus Micrarchaeaceae archaeon]
MPDPHKLDFAYKYPFSDEAKEIVGEHGGAIDIRYLDMGRRQIESAISVGIPYSDINVSSAKLDYIMAYLYSRMLLSTTKRIDLIRMYSAAEARRSANAMQMAGADEVIAAASQAGIRLARTFEKYKGIGGADEFSLGFDEYISNIPKAQGFGLVNRDLSSGVIVLDRGKAVAIIEQAMAKEIGRGLPIRLQDLPKQVVDYSRGLRFGPTVTIKAKARGAGTEAWIEALLQTPIADVRHRTVNLILAPYLVNTKGLDVEQACKIIGNYIERCRQVDPSTRINDSYIRYQCSYAKRRGLKPLSFERAKELLGDAVSMDSTSRTGASK